MIGKGLEGSNFRHTFAGMVESWREGISKPQDGENGVQEQKVQFS